MSTAPNYPSRTLYHGDNLEFLRGMNSETVDLVATDPPFNKSRDFHATPDSLAAGAKFEDRWRWDEDVHDEWVDQVKDDWPKAWTVIEAARASWGDGMGAYLCWLGVRLMECHRVLKPTGTLYLHIDHTAHAYVKALLDGIFGRKNFRNEIIWCYSGGGQPTRDFPRKHDTILRYSKSKEYVFNKDAVRVPYDSDYKATVFAAPHTRAPGKTYVPHPDGKIVEDWWRGIARPYGKRRSGYPTEKPLPLYERMILASTHDGDLVLDPFCGCATTPVAAERLGRQWVGIDIWDEAYSMVLDRLADEGLAVREGGRASTRLITFGDVQYSTTPPQRTDDDEVAAPVLKLKLQRALEPWQRLRHGEIVEHLVEAQASQRSMGMGSDRGGHMVVCAGCGRVLEREFMQLDHIQPRAEGGVNDITNRILLCQPCNGRKGADFTLRGLVRRNKREEWMQSEDRAKIAQASARQRAEHVREGQHA